MSKLQTRHASRQSDRERLERITFDLLAIANELREMSSGRLSARVGDAVRLGDTFATTAANVLTAGLER